MNRSRPFYSDAPGGGGGGEATGSVAFQFVAGVVHWDQPSTWSSRAIQYRTASYTHVDFVMPNGYGYPPGSLLGARSDKIGNIPPGVQCRPANYEPWATVTVLCKSVPKRVERAVYAAALAQRGKPYDAGGILSFITGRYPTDFEWSDQESWFCDELAVWATVTGGAAPKPALTPNRIDPGGASLFLSGAGFA